MRRWNGWGEQGITYPFPDPAAHYLEKLIGQGSPTPDELLENVLTAIPPSRLPHHSLIKTDQLQRLMHACGQSLPDWVALRSGRINAFPDGIANPKCQEDIRSLLTFAHQIGAHVIPYGGGTSVVGHINPLPGDIPVLTIDLSSLNQLIELDETSRLATFGAGVKGPHLEAQLRGKGYTLGHFPQSFEFSTLGGWIATRSSGQQSYYYGRIEDLFAGGHLETPAGPFDLPPLPASAAGPDLRQIILGSEGRLGIITNATLRVRSLPQVEAFYAIFFRDWEASVQATRQIAQERIPISMARLSDPDETETTLMLSGKENLVTWARRGLNLLQYGPECCLLIFGVTGDSAITRMARKKVTAIGRAYDGLPSGAMIGKMWRKSRFLTPYLRNTLWDHGYAVDTLETALPWTKVIHTTKAIKETLGIGLSQYEEQVLAFAHLSHLYGDGASIYITYLFRRSQDPDETLNRWKTLKSAASQIILAQGGTISHQHGVGMDHAPYLYQEKGKLGINLLKGCAQILDPYEIMNPGKMWE